MKKTLYRDYAVLLLSLFAASLLVFSFTNIKPWISSSYNSYVIQAKAWLSGRLDLGRDYSWLEIARFDGKFYISFPPFPSYIMLPFVAIFGEGFRSGIIAFAAYILSGIYAYRILKHFGTDGNTSVFYALFLVVCSNYFFIALSDWVWFIAQNICFTLCIIALYYALKGKGTVTFILWACAVGCRPFTLLYLPLYILVCWKNTKVNKNQFIVNLVKWSIIPIAIGISYMVLNFLRFGNPFEFGHNYLPEFLEAEKGQFSLSYFMGNLHTLIRLPEYSGGVVIFPQFNGMNMFIASPVFIIAAVAFVRGILKGDITVLTALLVLCTELFCILCHKTMGGYHYGNRYTIDVLPLAFYAVAAYMKGKNLISDALALSGFGLNLVWITKYFV